MYYNFSTERANEINEDNELAKKEALVMKDAFEKYGGKKYSIECSHIWGQACINERMFDLVKEEYFKL